MSGEQLRLYRIAAGRLDDFADAWSNGVEPLRRQFGFTSQAWKLPELNLFVWLVTYAGAGPFEDADAAYYASPERAALEPDPARWIEVNETGSLVPVSVGRSSGGGNAP
jgi:hypothetical protein